MCPINSERHSTKFTPTTSTSLSEVDKQKFQLLTKTQNHIKTSQSRRRTIIRNNMISEKYTYNIPVDGSMHGVAENRQPRRHGREKPSFVLILLRTSHLLPHGTRIQITNLKSKFSQKKKKLKLQKNLDEYPQLRANQEQESATSTKLETLIRSLSRSRRGEYDFKWNFDELMIFRKK